MTRIRYPMLGLMCAIALAMATPNLSAQSSDSPAWPDRSTESNTAPLNCASGQPISTLPILAAMPDTVMFALAFPPLPTLCDKLLALSARFPQDAERVVLANALVKAALGTDLRGIAEFMSTKGFAPNAPCGVFMDLDATAEDAADVVQKCAKAAQENALTPAMNYHPPAMLAMFGVTNPETAEAAVREVLLRNARPVQADNRRSDIESNLRWMGDDLAYCARGSWLYITNSEALFKATVAKQAEPNDMRYGTNACPATTPDDIVLLTRLDRVTASMPDLLAMLSYAGRMATFLNWAQPTGETQRRFRDFYAPKTGADPLITTLSINHERVEVTSRLDLAAHPGFARPPANRPRSGLSKLIAPGNLLSAYIDWGDSLVAAADNCLPLIPIEIRDYYMGSLRRVLEQFASGEAAVGIHSGTPPVIQLFAAVANPVEAASLLRQYLETASITGLDREVWRLPLGTLDLYCTLEGGVLVAVNVKDQLPALCDAVRTGGSAPFYANLNPPIMPDESLFVFSLNTLPTAPIVSAMSAFGIQSDAAIAQWFTPVREIRAGKTIERQWQTQFLTFYLNP